MASTNRRSAAPKALKVLVADDQPSTLSLLSTILRAFDCEVITAANGVEAVEQFQKHAPDCMLLDVHMPLKDGFEACREIKELSKDGFSPVLLITSDRSQAAQTRAALAGADDCLLKPVSPELLQAKVKSFEQISRLQTRLSEQQRELDAHRSAMRREHELARGLFSHVLRRGAPCENVRRLEVAADVFHGDIVLTAFGAEGRQFILVGDFTGHGLQAALGALPAADIFYSMTRSGFGVADLARELNKRFHSIFPADMFLCACLLEIDHRSGSITAWNGGLPPVFVRDSAGVLQSLESSHLPLGVLDPLEFDDSLTTLAASHGDRIYVYSDGVIEQTNASGERFDMQRLRAVLSRRGADDRIFDELQAALAAHRDERRQDDDMTLIEVLVEHAVTPRLRGQTQMGATREALSWSLDLTLEGRALRQIDPKPLLMRALYELQGLDSHRESLQTVLSELYNDALDHGVLKCDPTPPRSPEGFAAHLAEREQRLDAIESGCINVTLRHEPTRAGGSIQISVGADGGSAAPDGSNERPTLRELELVRSICASLDFSDHGRKRHAVYEWKDPRKVSEEAA